MSETDQPNLTSLVTVKAFDWVRVGDVERAGNRFVTYWLKPTAEVAEALSRTRSWTAFNDEPYVVIADFNERDQEVVGFFATRAQAKERALRHYLVNLEGQIFEQGE